MPGLSALVIATLVLTTAPAWALDRDCEVGPWEDCSACSVTCGEGGVQLCARTVTTPRSGAGLPCPSLFEQRPCPAAPPCALDCEVSEWASCSQRQVPSPL